MWGLALQLVALHAPTRGAVDEPAGEGKDMRYVSFWWKTRALWSRAKMSHSGLGQKSWRIAFTLLFVLFLFFSRHPEVSRGCNFVSFAWPSQDELMRSPWKDHQSSPFQKEQHKLLNQPESLPRPFPTQPSTCSTCLGKRTIWEAVMRGAWWWWTATNMLMRCKCFGACFLKAWGVAALGFGRFWSGGNACNYIDLYLRIVQ